MQFIFVIGKQDINYLIIRRPGIYIAMLEFVAVETNCSNFDSNIYIFHEGITLVPNWSSPFRPLGPMISIRDHGLVKIELHVV